MKYLIQGEWEKLGVLDFWGNKMVVEAAKAIVAAQLPSLKKLYLRKILLTKTIVN